MMPFVRWPGGKRKLAPRVLEHIPRKLERLVEPFAGGAAVFFTLCGREKRAVPVWLNDANGDLMALYRTVRDNVEGLIAELGEVEADKALYYALRNMEHNELLRLDDHDRGARAYYLNRCAFNGVWRVNSTGGMNVPYGRTPKPLADAVALRAASSVLQGATLTHGSFVWVFEGLRPGDVVYLDPPYPGGFTSYTAAGFGEAAHRKLAQLARSVSARHRVVVSLPDCELVRELYPPAAWQLHEVSAPRSVSCDGNGRQPVPELIIVGG